MYPFFRVFLTLQRAKRHSRVHPLDTCVLTQSVWPTDLDIYAELNNAKYLTLMELARWDMGVRTGLVNLIKREKYGLVVAGCSIRYRKRLRLWQKFQMHTRVVGVDQRWVFIEQSIFRNGQQCTGALFRTGVTSRNGLVSPAQVFAQLGVEEMPHPPDWVAQWDQSDNSRPWLDQA